MEEKYWHQRWHFNEIAFNQSNPNELLRRYFDFLTLKPGDRVFVPLCGKSVDMLFLISKGLKVIGIDLSPLACQAFFNENNIPITSINKGNFIVFQSEQITLIAGDIFQLNKKMLGHIAAVYDRAALIALPENLRQRYATCLIKWFNPGTQIFLISMSYDQNAIMGPPFSVDEKEVAKLYGLHFSIKQLYNEEIKVPAYFQDKGLTTAYEQVYLLR